MRQLRCGDRLSHGLCLLLVACSLAGLDRSSRAQELLKLPDWMQLQLSVTAEPLFNPLGGERSAMNARRAAGFSRAPSAWMWAQA